MAESAIFTVGLLTLCAHFASALSRERIFLWFGLFAAPYGLGLILRSILLPEWDARVDLVVVIVGRLIGLASIIPALLLFREFYGKGWRLSSKWLIWAYAFAVVAVLFFMATHERASAIPSPGITLVILVPLVLFVDRLAGYHPPSIKGRPVIFWGTIDIFPDVLLRPSIPFVDGWRSGGVGAVRVSHSDDLSWLCCVSSRGHERSGMDLHG
jgi:hypothetical protein